MKIEYLKEHILIPGITGFLALQIAKDLLEKGYLIKGTVRSISNESKMLAVKELPFQENLEICEADLMNPESIDAAVNGCDHVMHVAAPVLMTDDESQIVTPAVEGTKAIMTSAIKYGVKAVIMTSSMAAIVRYDVEKLLTEEDWPDLTQYQPPYIKAKSLSEKAAWEIYESAPKETRPRLIVINPGYILGPPLSRIPFHSGNLIRQLLDGSLKEIPHVSHAITDVRDVAEAHVKALENKDLTGERYLCHCGECLWMEDIVDIVKEEFTKFGYEIVAQPLAECPNKDPKNIYNIRWGKSYKLSNEKIKKDLGMSFKTPKESIIDMGYGLIKQGLVPDVRKK